MASIVSSQNMQANLQRAFADHGFKHSLTFSNSTTIPLSPSEEIFCVQGKRPTLEDTAFFSKSQEYCLWCVCDGHGDGGKIGKLAAETIPRDLPSLVAENGDKIPEAFTQMLEKLQSAIRQRCLAGGSTVVINYLDLKTQKLYVATLGDSWTKVGVSDNGKWRLAPLSPIYNWATPEEEQRAFLFAGNELERTRELWSYLSGKHRYFPIQNGYNVSRALGHLSTYDKNNRSPFSVQPLVTEFSLKPGDVVLSASDGFWGSVHTDVIEMILESHAKTPMKLAESLGKFSLMKSSDNVSIIALKV
ncbi:MAG: protein serine/threonine phosphatase 2C family protein [Verrucomicrobia bacterium]|nr:protein serine/threonine phosphatase 2C family protein [Verrucomicrobiota bacterium]